MAFVPAVDMLIWRDQREATSAVVIGVDPRSNLMWLRPIDGGRPVQVEINDRWSVIVRKPTLPEGYAAIGQSSMTRGFATRAAAITAGGADWIALVHVFPDGTATFEYRI